MFFVNNKVIYLFKPLFLILIFVICIFNPLKNNTFAAEIVITPVSTESDLITAIANGGYIQLANDINITKTLTVKKNMTLDLNGYVLRQTANLVVINGASLNGKTLTITDSNPNANSHYFIKHDDKAWEYVLNHDEEIEYEIITGGIITGGKNKVSNVSGGGAIKLDSVNDYVIINGGTIVGNYAARAGGCSYGGAVTLNNGRICGNAADSFAGAIALSGDFTMNGGIIEDNYSPLDSKEYNFYKTDISIGMSSNFKVMGGVVSANIATVTSASTTTLTIGGDAIVNGNIYLQNGIKANITGGKINGRIRMTKGSFTMSGGEITGGVADDEKISYRGTNGGGISVEGGNCTITGGSIYGNQANQNGGGIYVNGGTFKMEGGNIYNNTSLNGAGVYVNSGTVVISNGSIKNNSSTNGGGIFLSGGSIEMNGGNIFENTATENGGGIGVSSGNIIMNAGIIKKNSAINGGGFYLTGGTFNIKNGSEIIENTATNGAGGYVIDGNFNLTGGTTSRNVASLNGGGYYIINTTTANLSNGIISSNQATNGGGFYQTQDDGQKTSTTLSGTCYVNNNTSLNGNGGGIYVDGGSTFRIISGKVIYNKAVGFPSANDLITGDTLGNQTMVYAKDSSAGVGGGVYIANGIFTMKDTNSVSGTAAIFGNVADYAADDLFSSGVNTLFDAIPVTDMEKDDAYLNSTDWFEDYPKGEYHQSLKISDNHMYVTSSDRYSKTTSEDQLVLADSVLSQSSDYICITMGANVGEFILKIDDKNVGSDNIFIYNIRDNNSNVNLNVSLKKGKNTKIINMPIGNYKLTLKDGWSWKYEPQFKANVIRGDITTTLDMANSIDFVVVGGQTIYIDTSYEIKNRSIFSKNLFTVKSINNGIKLREME